MLALRVPRVRAAYPPGDWVMPPALRPETYSVDVQIGR